MNKKSFLFSLALGLLVLPTSLRAEITFAVVGGMSGDFEKIGVWFKQGTRGAVEEINKQGGLLGEKVKFVTRNDECNPEKAVEIAKELAAKKITFVMGHLCSGASIAASDIYEKNGIIAISPSSTNPDLTDRGMKNIFRTTGRDDMQGFVLADHILRSYKTKKLAIIYDDNAYSRGMVNVTKKFLNQAGLNEAMFEQAPGEPFDYSKILSRIKKEKVRIVVYPAMPGPVAELLRQAKAKKIRFRLLGGDSFTNFVLEGDEVKLLNGVQFSFTPDPSDDELNKENVAKYKAEGFNPEAFTFYSYGAVQAWAAAVKSAGTLEASKVSKSLRSNTFDTVLGKIKFDDKGDISSPGFVIYYFQNGKKYYFE